MKIDKQNKKQDIEKIKCELEKKEKYITRLKLKNKKYKEKINNLEKEIVELNETIKAQECVTELMMKERRQAEEIIKAHEELEKLQMIERKDDIEMLKAKEKIMELSILELKERDNALKNILEVNKSISSILELDYLLTQVLYSLVNTLKAQRGILLLNDKSGLKPVVFFNIDKKLWEDQNNYTYIKDIVKKTYESNQLQYIMKNNVTNGENNKKEISVISAPLLYNNELKGIIYIDKEINDEVFKRLDIEVATIFCSQAAISIENAKLYNMAITDGLTGLYTHRHLEFLLDIEIERASRFRHPLVLIMIDIDHFKKFNDNYGHQIGDLVLKEIARIIKENSRKTDIVARYGGEEMTVVLPEIDIMNGKIVAEKFRKAIEDFRLKVGEEELKVTISLGVAAFPQHATDAASLIKAADSALYQSKKNGRNQVTVY